MAPTTKDYSYEKKLPSIKNVIANIGVFDTPTAKAVGFLSALSNAGHFCFVQALSLRLCHHPSHGRAYSSMGTHTMTI